jgi:hypothetical protein
MIYGGIPYGAAPYGGSGSTAQYGDIFETLALATSTATLMATPINDSLVLAFSLTVEEVFAIVESIAMEADATTQAIKLATLVQSLGLDDVLTPILQEVLTETIDLDDVLTGVPTRFAAIIDSLILTGAATNTLAALAVIADALALADLIRSVQVGEVSESLNLLDDITTRLSAFEAITAELAFSDALTGLATVTAIVPETFNLTGAASALGTFLATLDESIEFAVGFVFDDTPYIGLALNADTKAVTTYTRYEFNSLTTFGGVLYGADADGLHNLQTEGDDDAGAVPWRIRTGLSRLADGKQCRLESAYLGIHANGEDLYLKCIYVPGRDGGGEKLEQWYSLRQQDGGMVHETRVKVGRGMKAVYWAVELAGTGPLDLDHIELRPLALDRRI